MRLSGAVVGLSLLVVACGGDADRIATLEQEIESLRNEVASQTAPSTSMSAETTVTTQPPTTSTSSTSTTMAASTSTVPATSTTFNPNEVTPERQELVDVVREYLSDSYNNPVASWSDEEIVANTKAACQTPDDRLIDWASASAEEGVFAKLARKHCAGEPIALDFGLWEELFIQDARVVTQESALYRNLSDAELLDDAHAACETFFANGNEIEIVKHFWRSTSSSELEAEAAVAFVVLTIDEYQLCFGH